jgi:hypothetical protein
MVRKIINQECNSPLKHSTIMHKNAYALRTKTQTGRQVHNERINLEACLGTKHPSRRNCIQFKVRSSKCDVALATSNNNNNSMYGHTDDGINASALIYDDDNEDDEEVRCRFASKLLK